MPRAGQTKPPVTPPVEWIAIGVLTRTFPPELVDRVIAKTGRGEQRQRLLPARVVVYYTLAMCLFAHVGYEEVMRLLAEGLAWARRWRGAWQVPDKSSIARARARAGAVAAAGVVRRGRPATGHKGDLGGVISLLAAGGAGRHYPGRGGYSRQPGGVRPARWWPGQGAFVQCGWWGGGVRHACGHGRGHGRGRCRPRWRVRWAGDAAAGRSGPVRPGAMAHLPGDGGGVGVALPPGRQAGGAGGLRGWLVARRAGPQPAREQTGRGAGGGLPPGRSWPRGRAARVSPDHHNPLSRAGARGGAAGAVSAACTSRGAR
jgi:Insertion element 4 transposase N-terminal